MKRARQILIGLICFLFVGLFIIQPADQSGTQGTQRSATGRRLAQDPGSAAEISPVAFVSEPVLPTTTVAVRDLPPFVAGDILLDREVNPRFAFNVGNPNVRIPGGPDPLLPLQAKAPAPTAFPFLTPILNYDGQGYTNVNPPDTVGDVGPNHYVQSINQSGGTRVQIYNKDGTIAKAAFALDSLGSGNCANGLGDPIVLYDRLADRWFLSEFSSSGNQLCHYISQTPDPTGAYYAYAFTAANSFPDYPKYGVWPDAYYAGTNESSPTPSPTLYAFDRTQMLTGAAATYQSFNAPGLSGFGFQMITPSDLDGATPPPAGSPNYFMRHRDTEAHGAGTCPNAASGDCLEIFEFTVDWVTPANSGINGPIAIPVSEFDSDLCGLTSFTCIDQPGNANYLDPLREVTMWRVQYRNFGTHETLVGNLATDVSGSDDAGVRWFELRKVGAGSWTLFQEGTYAPDGDSRWMGSAAMDSCGNIAVAYNVSSSTTFPGLRYAGRLATDPSGTLPQGEGTIINGTANNGSNRYGDYAAMSVDPADDATFWFTGMYNVSSQWSTRIASFKFTSCTGSATPDFTIDTTPPTQEICVGSNALYDVDATGTGGFLGSVDLAAVGNPGSAGFSPNPITPDGISILTISGATAGNYTFDVLGTSVLTPSLVHTNTIGLDVLAAAPGAPTLTAPGDGATGVDTQPTFSWTAVFGASGYDIEIATDAGFSTIVDSATVATNSYTPSSSLNVNTTYYWRVRATNVCGTSSYSTPFSFTTGNISCVVYPSTDVPKPIPPSGTSGTTISNVTIASGGTISDVNVLNLVGTHTWMGDLDFYLDSPATTQVQLQGQACGSADNFDLNYDDSGSGTPPCPPTDGGTYPPFSPLSAFNGEDSTGTWTLTIVDNALGDTGQLDSWSLEVCFQVTCTAPNGVTDLAVSQSGSDVVLDWTATNADEYQVHRSTTPYFTPGPGTLHATTTNATYTDVGVAGNGINYFYAIVAANSCGAAAGESNAVSEFEFAITPGT